MSRQLTSGTRPEVLLRTELHRRGLRYRVDFPLVAAGLARRRADLVFPRRRVAVFVDGCFWHSCSEYRTSPKSNSSWWGTKLATNVTRDRDTDRRLVEAGWAVIRIWEHEAVDVAADRVEAVVRSAPAR